MAYVERPDGARIYYEVRGTGFPLLLFAPGGVNSQVSFWPFSAINALDFADEFMVIGMDQRNAERSPGPLAAPTWEIHAVDQRAVLDALGVERTLLWGGCIGVAFALRFIKEAPARVAAAVCQDPVGYAEGLNDRETFSAMWRPTIALAGEQGMQAVVDAAIENPMFMRNNAAGPFAARIASDPAFRNELIALDPAAYQRIVRGFDENLFGTGLPFASVDGDYVRTCQAPLLVLPGLDVFHPTPVAERLCREAPRAHCLDVGCRRPENLEATKRTVRQFLHEHAR
jgi:pimeloyl-ACP methyl ester carboxylesterase